MPEFFLDGLFWFIFIILHVCTFVFGFIALIMWSFKKYIFSLLCFFRNAGRLAVILGFINIALGQILAELMFPLVVGFWVYVGFIAVWFLVSGMCFYVLLCAMCWCMLVCVYVGVWYLWCVTLYVDVCLVCWWVRFVGVCWSVLVYVDVCWCMLWYRGVSMAKKQGSLKLHTFLCMPRTILAFNN